MADLVLRQRTIHYSNVFIDLSYFEYSCFSNLVHILDVRTKKLHILNIYNTYFLNLSRQHIE